MSKKYNVGIVGATGMVGHLQHYLKTILGLMLFALQHHQEVQEKLMKKLSVKNGVWINLFLKI